MSLGLLKEGSVQGWAQTARCRCTQARYPPVMALWTECSRMIPIARTYRQDIFPPRLAELDKTFVRWTYPEPESEEPVLIYPQPYDIPSGTRPRIPVVRFWDMTHTLPYRHCTSGFMFCHSPLFIYLLSLYIFLMYPLYLCAIHAPHGLGG